MELHKKFFQIAAGVAKRSLCLNDKCGAIVVLNDQVIGSGYNAPPNDDISKRKCKDHFPVHNRRKPKSDITCCVHAEWRAIIAAVKTATKAGHDLKNSILYFTRVDDDGEIIHSGDPYCTVCSRMALDTGITTWVLWHDTGIKLYDTVTANELSYDFHRQS